MSCGKIIFYNHDVNDIMRYTKNNDSLPWRSKYLARFMTQPKSRPLLHLNSHHYDVIFYKCVLNYSLDKEVKEEL